MKRSKCFFVLLTLATTLMTSHDACAASSTRSFLSRAIAPVSSFVSSHPRLTKTAGIGVAALGAYALYTWWTRKPVRQLNVVAPFGGKEIYNWGNEAGHPHAFVALPDNRFASGHDHGVVKIWDAETKQCINTVDLKEWSTIVSSFHLLDNTRLLVGTSSGTLYMLELSNQGNAKRIGEYRQRISSIVPFSEKEVIINFDQQSQMCSELVNIVTGDKYQLNILYRDDADPRFNRDVAFVAQLDSKRLFFVSIGQDSWFGVIASEVIRKKYRAQQGDLQKQGELILKKSDFQFTKSLTSDSAKGITCAAVLHDDTLVIGSWPASVGIWNCRTGDFRKKIEMSSKPPINLLHGSPAWSILELPDKTVLVGTLSSKNILYAFSRDAQGNTTGPKQYRGQAPLLLLPQGLVTSDFHGAIRLVQ